MQELLAVPLLLATFAGLLQHQLLLVAIDNQGVLGSLLSGRAGADDMNMCIGKLWLDIAASSIGLHVVRVESKSNLADGTTRESLGQLEALNTRFVDPKLPKWVYDIWEWP